MPRHGTHDYEERGYAIRVCLDCPAKIPAFGNKVRCAPCASAHFEANRNLRNKERYWAKRKAQDGGGV